MAARRLALPGGPGPPRRATPRTEVAPMKMSTFSGDQIAQVNNPDPFAMPGAGAPRCYHTPGWIIAIVQLARLLWRLVLFVVRHPLARPGRRGPGALAWHVLGWPGPVALAAHRSRLRWSRGGGGGPVVLPVHRAGPGVGKWRRWHYRRHWAAVMTIGRLAAALPRPDPAAASSARSPRPATPTGCRSGWCPASPPRTSPPGPRTWPTGSARCSAGSAPAGPARGPGTGPP